MFKSIKTLIVLFILACVFVTGFGLGKYIYPAQKSPEVKARFDETVIIQKIQNLSKLEVLEMVIQRDLDVDLDLGKLEILGLSIEKKRSQKISLVGKVTAGIDFAAIGKDNIIYDNNNLILNLPATKILSIKIDDKQTQITKDNLSVLYRLENISDDKRLELNEILRKQVAAQSEIALLEGACKDGILLNANKTAKTEVARLFAFAPISALTINIMEPQQCLPTK
jgi:hypothetical protein